MAIQSVAATPQARGNQVRSVERDANVALGLPGIIQIMDRYTTGGSDSEYSTVSKLTNIELVTVIGCESNERDALTTGLRTLGELVSNFDAKNGEMDHNGVGWLVKTLAEQLDSLHDLSWSATDELARRGYNSNGVPLKVRA